MCWSSSSSLLLHFTSLHFTSLLLKIFHNKKTLPDSPDSPDTLTDTDGHYGHTGVGVGEIDQSRTGGGVVCQAVCSVWCSGARYQV